MTNDSSARARPESSRKRPQLVHAKLRLQSLTAASFIALYPGDREDWDKWTGGLFSRNRHPARDLSPDSASSGRSDRVSVHKTTVGIRVLVVENHRRQSALEYAMMRDTARVSIRRSLKVYQAVN